MIWVIRLRQIKHTHTHTHSWMLHCVSQFLFWRRGSWEHKIWSHIYLWFICYPNLIALIKLLSLLLIYKVGCICTAPSPRIVVRTTWGLLCVACIEDCLAYEQVPNTNRNTSNSSLWAFLLQNPPVCWPALLWPEHKTRGLLAGGHQGHLSRRPTLWGLALPNGTAAEHASSSHSAGLHPALFVSATPPSTSTLHFLPFKIPAHITSLLGLTLAPRITGESLSGHRARFYGSTHDSVPLPAWELLEGMNHVFFTFVSQYLFYTWHLVGNQRMFIQTKCSELWTFICPDATRESHSTSRPPLLHSR